MTHLRVGLKFSSVRCSVFSFRWLNTHKNTLNPPKSSTGHLTPRLSSRQNNRQRVYFIVFGVPDLSLKKHRRNVEFLYRIQCGDVGHLSRLRHPDLDPDYTRVRRLHIQKWSSSFQERRDLHTIRGIFTEFSSTQNVTKHLSSSGPAVFYSTSGKKMMKRCAVWEGVSSNIWISVLCPRSATQREAGFLPWLVT